MTVFAALLATALVATAPTTAPAQASAADLAGRWEGALSVNGVSIRVVLNVEAADGGVRATMDSPDQGATGLLVEGPTIEGGVVRFGVPQAGGRFEGRLSEDGRTLTGALFQGPANLPIVFTRTEAVAQVPALNRPQTPVGPFPYRAEDVVIDTPTPGVRLAGTLTLPEGQGPFPAVLLITGSGGQDRDETIFAHKPFLVLADALTRRGVAVLRVDDRGVGASTSPGGNATTADFAIDAQAAFDWLVARPETADARVGLLGHSEGGTIAPLVARADPRVGFIVLMAGPAVSGAEVLTEQSRRLQTAAGLPAEVVEANVAVQARNVAAIAAHADDPDAAEAAVRASMAGTGAPQAAIDQAAVEARSPWARWFIAHDPRPALSSLTIPVLGVYGGRDVQVPADQSATALRAAVPSAEIVVLPELNHLLQTAGSGMPAEYATIEETIDPEALKAIVDWIAAR